MRPFRFIPLALFQLLLLGSCYYDNEEQLYGDDGLVKDCDTADVSFSSDIRPLIDSKCNSCHGDEPLPGAAKFTTYNLLKIYLDGNKKGFIESITHTGSAIPMPDGEPKLPECEISKLVVWINNGYPNN